MAVSRLLSACYSTGCRANYLYRPATPGLSRRRSRVRVPSAPPNTDASCAAERRLLCFQRSLRKLETRKVARKGRGSGERKSAQNRDQKLQCFRFRRGCSTKHVIAELTAPSASPRCPTAVRSEGRASDPGAAEVAQLRRDDVGRAFLHDGEAVPHETAFSVTVVSVSIGRHRQPAAGSTLRTAPYGRSSWMAPARPACRRTTGCSWSRSSSMTLERAALPPASHERST